MAASCSWSQRSRMRRSMNKVAVQLLIGRNEEPFLPYAIRSVGEWVDYFTVVNTAPESEWGSKNKQIVFDEISEDILRYTELTPDENDHFSFADARNAALAMTDTDDYVFIVDADDVHFPEWEALVQDFIRSGADQITAYFYHLMVYKNIYQYVQPREIIYKNYEGTHWSKGVHEVLVNTARHPAHSLYHYMHYGYIKPQAEVFRRWKFYSDLEGDFTHYDGQNPETILDDRVAVCSPLPIDHPEVVRDFLLKNYPDAPDGSLRDSPPRRSAYGEDRVGLLLLTKDDSSLLDRCLGSLASTETPPSFTLLAVDCNSTDDSVAKLQEWQAKVPFEMEIVGTEIYTSLAETLNYGFDHFRQDDRFEYVGWIHPDMEFVQAEWLHWLWRELRDNKKIGKICSANFRDPMPSELISGHEQCYILRKDILHKIGLFDEKFVGIGGYEDWDFNRRVMMHQGEEGFYQVMISPKSWVLHDGMATRSRRDTRDEQIKNSQYYYEKWGTYQPPC